MLYKAAGLVLQAVLAQVHPALRILQSVGSRGRSVPVLRILRSEFQRRSVQVILLAEVTRGLMGGREAGCGQAREVASPVSKVALH